ncbi:Mov34/MPN/PAD-1 family protein [Sedimenticola selenatireducens]|jgi:proteasome lid subunit RPN8/RPN11|uniref:JAB1/MPN/MOV34 metalloenzyme domain-containing protein n=1 Tax=Sedimenticola selenatireducens TaxID=191960 RepID=A0A558DN35_9GAMM|nr:Mov34/MPN/PAD-1 family protein [Sedimenticola selenatireducens]TVO74855.1 hypothetical protein FHP88_10190 [Sedimenticola selenatireducens]TVT62390.1 MAG: hypothetical protein FHK78_14755 [Sedimenticola selenatireducens]
MSQLYLSQHLRDQLGLLASLGYPNETCGVLLGKQTEGQVSVHRIEETPYPNLEQADAHFNLDPLDLHIASLKAHRHGLEIIGIWRALPDKHYTPAPDEYKSDWTDYSYLLLSVTPRGVAGLRSWRLTSSQLTEEDLML